LPELRLLIVEETRVTERGIAALQASRPALQVWRSRGRAPAAAVPPIWYPIRPVPECSRPIDASEGEHATCTTT
jgi:hypothetical protein